MTESYRSDARAGHLRAAGHGDAVRHEVPYHAQWESAELVPELLAGRLAAEDDPLWERSGAATPEEYAFWSWRVCGMACLRMALEYWGLPADGLVSMGKEFLDAGAYVRRADGLDGLIYAPFAEHVARRWGIGAEVRPELDPEELPDLLAAGRLVMLSVHPSIREPQTRPASRGGHLVLAVGCTAGHLQIHNPSGMPGVSQRFAEVPWPALPKFFARRGVVLGR
ncbi:C39 family peptidase [Streptomyces sp. NPDC089919]|uniref:C39 family peptidase n=1 Tax=Streptomyces sp. NPDC089919 TaxID=3155188 RepID=UPI0034459CDA